MNMLGNEEHLKETLFKLKKFMDRYGIEFVLEGGALLGACRWGRLLPWDVDIDIHIPFKNYEAFEKANLFGLMRNARKFGFEYINLATRSEIEFSASNEYGNEYFKYPEIGLLHETQQWERYLRTTSGWKNIDKFTLYWKCSGPLNSLMERLDGYIHVDCILAVKGIHPEYETFKYDMPLDKVRLYDTIFNAPPDHMKYILHYYGDNWKDVFCSYLLWMKNRESIKKGIIPKEVQDFMDKWRVLIT